MPGYRYTPTEAPKESNVCPHCRMLLRDAVQTEEGYRLCHDCCLAIQELRPPGARCSDCGKSVLPGSKIYPDKAARKEIASICVKCPQQANYWPEGIPIGSKTHAGTPEQQKTSPVDNGYSEGVSQQQEDGALSDSTRQASKGERGRAAQGKEAVYCDWTGPLSMAEDHATNCPNRSVHCPSCGSAMTAAELEHHLPECPYRQVSCDFCHFTIPLAVHKHHHAEECQFYPFPCQWCDEIITLSHQEEHSRSCCSRSSDPQAQCGYNGPEDVNPTFQAIPTHNTQRHEVRSEAVLPSYVMVPGSRPMTISSVTHYQHNPARPSERFEQFGSRIDQSGAALSSAMEAVAQTSQQLGGAVGHSLADVVSELHDLKQRMERIESTRTDGRFDWLVPDIRRKYYDARNGRTVNIYSRPFYAGMNGYKMCLSLHLNGNGQGTGTHLSLFFVVMRSDFDDFLPWPFKQRVSLTLANQVYPQYSISEIFKSHPEYNISSFQRPVTEMNVPCGYQCFATQDVLRDANFTHGNSLFLKCKVDTEML